MNYKIRIAKVKFLIIFLVMISNFGFSQTETILQLELKEKAISHFQKSKYTKAYDLFKDYLEENPIDFEIRYLLGQTAYHLKKWDEAINCFKISRDNGFNIAKAEYNIACCYGLQGNKVEAANWLKKSINNLPSFYYQWMEDPDLELLVHDENYLNDLYNYDRKANTRESKWIADIDFFNNRMKQFHYNLFGNISEENWNDKINTLKKEVENLDDINIIISLMEMTASVGDGHTVMVPPVSGNYHFSMSPFLSYVFDEGIFITEAHKEYKQLLGAKITAINNIPIDEVFARIKTIIPSDNEYGSKWLEPLALSIPEILIGLNIIDSKDGFNLNYTKNEEEHTIKVDISEKLTAEFLENWMYGFHELKGWVKLDRPNVPSSQLRTQEPYWFEYLPESGLVVFHYNQIKTNEEENEQQFIDNLNQFIATNDVKALIIDLRYNEGGDNTIYRPILEGIITNKKINNTGDLFVLIGRRTFSAGMCFAVEMEKYTNAIFVGEPSGSSPNFVGESGGVFQLPFSGLYFNASNLFWQNSYAFDNRKYINPEMYVTEKFEDYKNGKDSSMEAIIQFVNSPK